MNTDRNQLLAQIVESAAQDLKKVAMPNPDDSKPKFKFDNTGADKNLPEEEPKAEEHKATVSLLKQWQSVHQVKGGVDSPNAKIDPQTEPMTKEVGKPFVKIAEEDIVQLLKAEAQMLAKTASVNEDIEPELEKVAMESLLELAELEKTAEEFGNMAAEAFLRRLGFNKDNLWN